MKDTITSFVIKEIIKISGDSVDAIDVTNSMDVYGLTSIDKLDVIYNTMDNFGLQLGIEYFVKAKSIKEVIQIIFSHVTE